MSQPDSAPPSAPAEPTGARVQAELEAAAQAAAEHARLGTRLAAADAELADAEAQVAAARARLADEAADVARLESFSPTRIWAGLRGSRESDLDRERAEQQQAEYAVAVAQLRRDRARDACTSLRSAYDGLGDVAGRRRAALDAKEAWLARTGAPEAAELEQVAADLGVLRSGTTELRGALVATDTALDALGQADRLLSSARGWSTADTFFDGGLLTDMVKYDRMDQAQGLMRAADDALSDLGVELADVGMEPVGGVEITDLVRAFDVWFDNIFSDWAVRERISEAAGRVAEARGAVGEVRRRLVDRLLQAESREAVLVARREDLLGG
ncbi:hypothetical protein I601_1827 [Nocardioides dokdonensis FR1436]|uniref:Uncharacterized protein n=1 Tax=Nocardioides dokdonensis FR1436 TaxID=1300347 RepID=A0A1A9GJ25_9ACTN|nr:hypothetical protein [Nocardioides dokdonensis]ANH38258.1 hypothetical protein I601_1827 [Nocardioides dokdonensis FR1436]